MTKIRSYANLCLFIIFISLTTILIIYKDNVTHKPWQKLQPLLMTGYASGNGERTAIITNSAETVVVLNNENELIYRIQAGERANQFVSAELVEIDSNNYLYVYDKNFGGVFGINLERILKYSPSGEHLGVIYSYTYENLDFITTRGKISAIGSYGGYFYLVRLENDGFILEYFNTEKPLEKYPQIFFSYPNAFKDLLHCMIDPGNRSIVWTTKTGNVLHYYFSSTVPADNRLLNEIIADSSVSFYSADDVIVSDYRHFTAIDSYSLSNFLLVKRWVLFIICAINAVLLALLIIRGAIFILKQKISNLYRQIIIVSICIIIGSGLFFTVVRNSIHAQYIQITYNELENISKLISASIDINTITKMQSRSEFTNDDYTALCDFMRKVFSGMSFEGKQVYFNIWIERGGVIYSMYDLEYALGIFHSRGEYKGSFLENVFNTGSHYNSIVKNSSGTWVGSAGPIYDENGNIAAFMEIGYNIRSVEVRDRTLMLQVAGIIVAVAIGFILFITAFLLMFDAHRKNKIKSTFLANMSHEIRTPMNAILGIAEIQLRDRNLNPDTVKALEKIYESGDLLLNIINDILDLSKIEAGKLELIPVNYDIPSLINDTAQLNRLRYDSNLIEFSVLVDENTPLNLFGDELRIKQILNNVLSNAYKYTEKGSIELCVKCEYDKRAPNEKVVIIFRVKDTGQGMSVKQLDKLFDEYARFNAEANRTTIGAGLGMSITKRLTDLMNGSIYVISEVDKGTEFTICIPQKISSTEVCGAELVEKLKDFSFQSTAITNKTKFIREYMPYGSVLVVDDVESNIYVTSGMLAPYGLLIDTVSSGFEAIDRIKNGHEYDIIFMDHMMPKMDGIEAVKIIRSMGYNHSIVALTANALLGRAEMFLQNGFDGYISKPIDSRELNSSLNELIRNKKPPEVVEEARQQQREGKMKNVSDSSQKLIQAIVKDAENAINVLENIYANINNLDDVSLNTYIITVHGMKSAFANIEEKGLSSFALKLERAGKEKNFNIIKNETLAFIDELRMIVAKFKPAVEEEEEITNEDAAYLRKKLIEIKDASAVCDKNTINDALGDLLEKDWPKHIMAVLDEITTHTLHSEFDKALSAAENFSSRTSPTRGSTW